MSKPFHFKQFSILHSNSSMKVGTDAVLLGTLTQHKDPKTILDIGTGTGIIGLMLAQRYPEAKVDLIEKDRVAFEEAKINVKNSPFKDRMTVWEGDFESIELTEKYDLIVSNPPYHLEDFVSEDIRRSNSRSTTALHPYTLLKKSLELLKEEGKLWLISPTLYFEHCLAMYEGYLDERIDIRPKENKPVNRIISCWNVKKAVPKQKEFILRKDDNDYTEDYKQLTQAFHPQY